MSQLTNNEIAALKCVHMDIMEALEPSFVELKNGGFTPEGASKIVAIVCNYHFNSHAKASKIDINDLVQNAIEWWEILGYEKK